MNTSDQSPLQQVVAHLTFRNMPIRRKFMLFSVGVSFWFLVLGALAASHTDIAWELAALVMSLVIAHALLLLFTVTITRSLKAPLDAIIEQIRSLTRGSLMSDGRLVISSGDELGELSVRFNRLLDALQDVNNFKRVIEEDDTTVEVYERLIRVFERSGLTESRIYETRAGCLGIYDALEREGPRWCHEGIEGDRNLCRAMKTAQAVRSISFPNICKQFAVSGRQHTCLPLMIGGSAEGVVLFVHDAPNEAAIEATRGHVETATRFIREALPVVEAKKLNETLRETGLRDPLTGLHNRRFLDEMRASLVAGAQRRGTRLGLLMCDLDHFKAVNDTYGHEAGDAVLRDLARVIAGGLRASDSLIRWGGEEFLAVLSDPQPDTSLAVAERVRGAVEAFLFQHQGVTIRKTVSIGLAEFPEDGATLDDVINSADAALYQAKEGGRNRVVRAHGTSSPSAPDASKAPATVAVTQERSPSAR